MTNFIFNKLRQSRLHKHLLGLLMLFFAQLALAGDYEDAWAALNKNDRKEAKKLFEKASKDPVHGTDALISLLYLNSFENRQDGIEENWKTLRPMLENPYPYIYAFWYFPGLCEGYGLKNSVSEKFLKSLIEDPKCPGTLKSAAACHLGHHNLARSDGKEASRYWGIFGSLLNWQFVGAFDNLGGSGFDKNYPPISQPEPTATFKTMHNADVKWFTPANPSSDGWIFAGQHIPFSTGVIYAQTFVNSATEQDGIICAGFEGCIKVWVNDHLLISESESRNTELDAWQAKCHLNKGNNRVLLQLSAEGGNHNFTVRITDDRFITLPGLTSSATYSAYTKDNTKAAVEHLTFWAEKYFQAKIAADPKNPINYLLLNSVLNRNNKYQESLELMEKALELGPQNSVLVMEHLTALSRLSYRTRLSEEVLKLRERDPNCFLALQLTLSEQMNQENYDDAEATLKTIGELFPKDADYYHALLELLAKKSKVDELLKTLEYASSKFPDDLELLNTKHNIEMQAKKNVSEAIRMYASFLKKDFDFQIADLLVSDYMKSGQTDKAIELLEKMIELKPWDNNAREKLYNYYFEAKENKKANQLMTELLASAPYCSDYHSASAYLAEQMGNKDEALQNFQKTLYYDPNSFKARGRIRELQNKKNLSASFPKYDIYDLIKKSTHENNKTDHNWYFVFDEQCTILYPEGCSESTYTQAVKVLTQKGIEAWQELNLGYNSWRQRLIVEKAETVKPNGNKIVADQNDGHLVFSNLEPGDAVYIKYRIVSYAFSRMSKEYWENYSFNGFRPVDHSRFCLLVPKNKDVKQLLVKTDIKPQVQDYEDYQLLTWETLNEPPMKDEVNMPEYVDVTKHLFLSTLTDWSQVANWYYDLTQSQAKSDYEVKKVIANLFPQGKTFTGEEKARIIYEYIVNNIQYSSIPFRQSAYVPQKASKVILTKLGDCKDVSNLFVTIAREVGLKARMVLVCTRDNGLNSMPLPSLDFNHCIVKVNDGSKDWYLELTDKYLPFGSLPNNLVGAMSLEIPYEKETANAKLEPIQSPHKVPDYMSESMTVDVSGKDMMIVLNGTYSGTATSNMRYEFLSLNAEKTKEGVQGFLGKKYSNLVVLEDVQLGNLQKLQDSVHFRYKFKVRNEVLEVGNMRTFKIPFFYTFLNPAHFQDSVRAFDLDYQTYEDMDGYEEEVTINIPEGKQLVEIPQNYDASFNGTSFSVHYEQLSPTKLKVSRKIKVNKATIKAADYVNFKKFMEGVLEVESRYIAYK